jgi:hypothetical protein
MVRTPFAITAHPLDDDRGAHSRLKLSEGSIDSEGLQIFENDFRGIINT